MKTFKQYLIEKKVIVYHGSKDIIDEFKYEYCGQRDDQLGSGFYFTTDIEEARGYGKNVHKCEVNIKRPLDADKIGNITFSQAYAFIKFSPDLDYSLSNWGDVKWEGKEKVMRTAAEGYTVKGENIVRSLFSLANDFYPGEIRKFNYKVLQYMNYDGIIKHHTNGTDHYVAFFPDQIKILGIEE